MQMNLQTLLGDYPGTKAIRDGRVRSQEISLDIFDAKVSNRIFPRVVNTRDFQVAEIALVTFFQARAAGRPLVLMPAVIGEGRHQHQCFVYNADHAKVNLNNLAGKKIGVRSIAQTTVTWVRGILQNEYGVDLDSIQWITFEDAHLNGFKDPEGIVRADSDKTLVQMLFDGDVDAAILGTGMPDDPRLKPIIPDPLQAAQQWSEKHQAISINHMVAIDEDFCRNEPEKVREVWRMLKESKSISQGRLAGGKDLTPFGIDENNKSLELLLMYASQQGLLSREMTVSDLFNDLTLQLT